MPERGEVVDLVIRFGQQVRLKCAFCTRFMARNGVKVTCGCGAEYQSASEDEAHWRVIAEGGEQ